ncbi:(2Fe-2S) ferredoxin domain-containing protein [Desulfobacula toluolica]|uniref:NADH-quinone oxidoreductase, subunit F, N-terminal n=1 Tax=Desulfobacula toluolica (strain DSM 7467 / Tol2) TaxID=651182 RepID=K0NQA4_DESTT|nr:NAD(P)H-dependent oxidoreductase subunit E [Desulfobacula toluolica]CCK81047.1 NADH-quinone oxidoreductase, subunit F, N-terminal Fragment [Desulfobacula toluolica Tol2]
MKRLTEKKLTALREKKKKQQSATERSKVLICGGTGCHATGSIAVKNALTDEIKKKSLSKKVDVIETGCNGFCALGPLMVVEPDGIFYTKLSCEDIPELVEEQLMNHITVDRLLFKDPITKKRIARQDDIAFFSHQMPRALRNKGLIDPENIDDYIAQDGYLALAKTLNKMSPEQIVDEMKKSGIRGRGGAGFPTGLKWDFARQSKEEVKYVLCNADEGDPGAFMDRSILEADPHCLLEGMTIAAIAIQASKGYIYCRTEYQLAIKRLEIAITQAKSYGLLGKDILNTGYSGPQCQDSFSFNLSVIFHFENVRNSVSRFGVQICFGD